MPATLTRTSKASPCRSKSCATTSGGLAAAVRAGARRARRPPGRGDAGGVGQAVEGVAVPVEELRDDVAAAGVVGHVQRDDVGAAARVGDQLAGPPAARGGGGGGGGGRAGRRA